MCWRIEVGQDSDRRDGLLEDHWEINGIDMGGGVVLDLPLMGANPHHKDLFLELDWVPGFEPQRAEILKLKEAFAKAPINAGGSQPRTVRRASRCTWTRAFSRRTASWWGTTSAAATRCRSGHRARGLADLPAAKLANFNPVRRLAFR